MITLALVNINSQRIEHEHRVLREGMEGRQHRGDRRLALQHRGSDAVDRNARGRHRPLRVDPKEARRQRYRQRKEGPAPGR